MSEKYVGYLHPKEIIKYAIWLYYRFNASLRDTVEGLFYRDLDVSHETVRQWVYKFGSLFSSLIKKKQLKRGDKWHLDEVCLTIKCKRHWLWRAIDQDGYELDVLLQLRRNTKAALRFFKKLLKGLCYVPRVIITDKLRSYKAAKKKVLKTTEHRSHKRLNNRIEASHQATRIREKVMRGFKSPRQAQVSLSIFGVLRNHFKIGFYKFSSINRRKKLREAFDCWDQIDQQLFCV
jgi:putative transposase